MVTIIFSFRKKLFLKKLRTCSACACRTNIMTIKSRRLECLLFEDVGVRVSVILII